MDDVQAGFVEAILAAPLGVTLLARIEASASSSGWVRLERSTPQRVHSAVDYVESMDVSELLEIVLRISMSDAGPWVPGAADTVAAAYLDARQRAPIAEAINKRFAAALHQPFDPEAQEWWSWSKQVHRALFRDFDWVYGAGQFTWSGLWTVSYTHLTLPTKAQV